MAGDLQDIEDNAPIASINVTPFVDVVLVLLVIFMVTAPVILKDVIGIQLPKTATFDAKADATLAVAITRQGQYLLAGELTDLSNIAAEVARRLPLEPNLQAVIAADTEARHGDVVRAIDTIKSAGLQRFAIQIERDK